ncbi:MAG: hypothetical protein AAFV25_09005, partial [Bacteroidota bacterium]
NLVLNYLDLMWMYSLSKGKLTFPHLSNIQTATTDGETLLQNKDLLTKLHDRLSSQEAVTA